MLVENLSKNQFSVTKSLITNFNELKDKIFNENPIKQFVRLAQNSECQCYCF